MSRKIQAAVLQVAISLVLLTATSPRQVQKVEIKYRHFDEYLLHLGRRYQAMIVEETTVVQMLDGEEEAASEVPPLFGKPLPIRTGVRHSKEEKCCMLGHLAGEKGFHCVSRFYASRLLSRNYNRAHNKRIPALLKGRTDPTADKLMRTFEQCVARRGTVFHKCCRHAAMQ